MKRIHRIIHGLLYRFSTSDERFLILQKAIVASTKSLYVLINEIKEEALEHTAESDTFLPVDYRKFSPEQLIALRQLVVSRIRAWATNETLQTHPRLLAILYAWQNWGEKHECENYVKKLVSTDPGLLIFLQVTLENAITEAIELNQKNPAWEKDLDNINAFIPAASLTKHASLLFKDNYFVKLKEREQLALMIFLDLTKTETMKLIPKMVE